MDQENLIKWKQDFEVQRREQQNKTKDMQRETMLRKKAMEMKAQLEAAKEEKRRQELLAERKAQHIEATMRFQRGVKNFKINKEAVNLEDVIKTMNPIRSRKNSADDRITVFNNQLANYYGINKNGMRPNSTSSLLKKSLSHESLYNESNNRTYTHFNGSANQYNYTNKFQSPVFNVTDIYNYNSNHNANNHYTFPATAPNQNFIYNNNNITNLALNNYSNNNQVNKPSQATHFREVLTENQRNIQNINNEALEEFQSMVKNEVVNNKQTKIGFKQQELSSSAEIADIMAGDEDILSEKDSMETDSLLNSRGDSPEPVQIKTISHKSDFQEDGQQQNVQIQPGSVRFISATGTKFTTNPAVTLNNNTNSNKNNTTTTNNDTNKDSNLTKLIEYNNYSDPLSALLNSNTKNMDLNQSKHQKPESVTKNVKNHFCTEKNNSAVDLNKLLLRQDSFIQSSSSIANSQQEVNSKNIKSILKRSSSFDTSLNVIGQQSQLVQFGIKKPGVVSEKSSSGIKDSIELTNSRINSAASRTESIDGRKKSVRFANQFMTSAAAEAEANESDEAFLLNARNELDGVITKQQVASTAQQKNNAIKNGTENDTNSQYSRISSANSIRRPVIKPRTTPTKEVNEVSTVISAQPQTNTLSKQTSQANTNNTLSSNNNNHSTLTNKNNNSDLKSDEKPTEDKPPMYPINFAGQLTGGYSVISQKRKELMLKNKIINSPKSNGSSAVNSPKASPSYYLSSPTTPANSDLKSTSLSGLNRPQLIQSPNYIHMLPKSTMISTTTTNLNIQPSSYKQPYVESNINSHLEAYNNNNYPPHHKSAFVFNEKYRMNFTDPSVFNNSNNDQKVYDPNTNNITYNNIENMSHAVPVKSYEPPQPQAYGPHHQYAITRIPLSPKSNIRSNFFFQSNAAAKVGNTENGTKIMEPQPPQQPKIAKGPFSAIPNATNIKLVHNLVSATSNDGNSNNMIPHGMIFMHQNNKLTDMQIQNRYNDNNTNSTPYAYLNSNGNKQQQQAQVSITQQPHQNRTMSAAEPNRKLNPTQSIHLEIKYPLYSNVQQQQQPAQYINISKPIRPSTAIHNGNEVGDSMSLFLKAEEMSRNNNYSEAQMVNDLKNNRQKQRPAGGQLTLSMEEQNIKNSIMRLNERLNLLSKNNNYTQPLNYYDSNKVNIDNNQNKYKKPISTYGLKLRR